MKYLIAGAGAIGGYIGAKMSQAGYDVTLFARGPHLAAMQQHGLKIIGETENFTAHPRIIGDLKDSGPFDVIFLGVKAHGLTQLAPQLKALITDTTTVVGTQNGIPFWFFPDQPLERVDPGGIVSASIPYKNVLASIVYFATDIAEPGVIRHNEGNRISLGEPDGSRSDRARAVAEALIKSGLRAPITARIKHEIFVKILGNVAFNPLSALTRATLAQMVRDSEVCTIVRNIMTEAEAVAAKLGMELPVSIDQRIAGAEKVGEHKTSMLQDLEAGRPMEIEAIAGAVVELGDRLGVPMPHTKTVYAATRLLDQTARGVTK
ncbi:MAG: 2-dehydropantoate 2-reductase [Acidobacteriia bacterium]|nr:2-dehydropantoate 2-reductase [Terriglobia bacterium]